MTAPSGDAPTNHLAVQPVGALVNSGITVGCGCGAGKSCPDVYLTLAQMVFFLTKAVGLDWAL